LLIKKQYILLSIIVDSNRRAPSFNKTGALNLATSHTFSYLWIANLGEAVAYLCLKASPVEFLPVAFSSSKVPNSFSVLKSNHHLQL
jgi:hypothetical protein